VEPVGQARGVPDRPGLAALETVRRGDADEDRLPVGPDLPDRSGDLTDQAAPALEVAAVVVLAAIGDRREELVEQVAVGAVDLRDLEAGLPGPAGRRPEGVDDRLDARLVEAFRPAWASWIAGTDPWSLMNPAMGASASACPSVQTPRSSGEIRPRGSTAVASVITAPAPPTAREPR
jgi:hypothetical protein